MAIDPSIALNVKPIQFESPMQSIGGLMQMRGQMADIALRNQQLETSKAQAADVAEQTAQRHRRNSSIQDLTRIISTDAAQKAMAAGDYSSVQGIDPEVSQPYIEHRQEQEKRMIGLTADKAALYSSGRDIVGKNVATLQGQLEADPNQAEALINQYNSMLPTLATQGIGGSTEAYPAGNVGYGPEELFPEHRY